MGLWLDTVTERKWSQTILKKNDQWSLKIWEVGSLKDCWVNNQSWQVLLLLSEGRGSFIYYILPRSSEN